MTLVPANIEGFAADWEIPVDEMRLWVLAHEFAGHGILAAEHVRGPSPASCASTSAASVPTPVPLPTASARSMSSRLIRWLRCSRRSATPRCSSVR